METKVKFVCMFGDPNTGVVISSINTNSEKTLGIWMHDVSSNAAGSAEFRLWSDGRRHKVSVEQMRSMAGGASSVYSIGRVIRSINSL